jgi:hypothetical protein
VTASFDDTEISPPTVPERSAPPDAAWRPLAHGQVIRPSVTPIGFRVADGIGGRRLTQVLQRTLAVLAAPEIALCDALVAFSGYEVIRPR